MDNFEKTIRKVNDLDLKEKKPLLLSVKGIEVSQRTDDLILEKQKPFIQAQKVDFDAKKNQTDTLHALDKCDAKEVQLNSWPRVIYDRSTENSNTPKVVTADELGLANSIKLAKQVEGRFSGVKPSMMMDCKPIPCYSLRIQEK